MPTKKQMSMLEEMAAKKANEYRLASPFERGDYFDFLNGAEKGYSDGYITAAREWVADVARKNRELARLRERVKELESQISKAKEFFKPMTDDWTWDDFNSPSLPSQG